MNVRADHARTRLDEYSALQHVETWFDFIYWIMTGDLYRNHYLRSERYVRR